MVISFGLIYLLKNFLTKKDKVKNSAAPTGGQGKYMIYVSFLSPSVVAGHESKRLSRALQTDSL
jgi:hypothetical protein